MIFSKTEVNTGRQRELDIVKALSIIIMILVHIYENLCVGLDTGVGATFIKYLGFPFGPTTFMFCMGMGLSYSRHNSTGSYVLRGVMLLTFGQVLILLREILPNCVGLLTGLGGSNDFARLCLILSVDIMQFAGMAFLTMALLKVLHCNTLGMITISMVMSVAGMFLAGFSTGNYMADQLLGFLFRTDTESYFPLFSWFIFVAFGKAFGDLYRRLNDKKQLFRIIIPVGAAFTAIYYILAVGVDQPVFRIFRNYSDFTGIGLPDALACLVLILFEISILALIGNLLSEKALRPIYYISGNINKFYCVSWFIILFFDALLVYVLGISMDSDWKAFLSWIVIAFLTAGVIVFYQRFLEKGMKKFFGKCPLFWIILIWVVSFAIAFYVFPRVSVYPNYMNNYLEGL